MLDAYRAPVLVDKFDALGFERSPHRLNVIGDRRAAPFLFVAPRDKRGGGVKF